MSPFFRLCLAGLVLALFAACGRKDHDHAPAAPGGHVHTAPHGGTLVEIGAHAYNLELLLDSAAGRLTAWVLDAHAENFVRVKAPAIEIAAQVGTARRTLTLAAVANRATGETVGDTSQFEAQADWLKHTASFSGSITVLEIRGTKFERIAFNVVPARK